MLKRPFLFLLGVVLPVITLLVELVAAMSAQVYLDPIPTWWHVALVAAVPAVNALVLLKLSDPGHHSYEPWFWANGIIIGVAGIYALAFGPIVLFSFIALIWFGLGLLPLSPILAFCASIAIAAALHRAAYDGEVATAGRHVRATAMAVVLGGGLFLCGDIPAYMTRTALADALSRDADTQVAGLSGLRRWGWRSELLRLCYQDRVDIRPTTHVLEGVPPADVQRIFFQAEGQPFNEIPMHRFIGFEQRMFGRNLDESLGGESVSGKRKKLYFDRSEIDVEVYPEQQLAYLEWTFEFQNDNSWREEARAQILLPAGGVVSRLTLWVNGEPREAAFAGTSQVQAAYQEVAVVQRCDPVLVTWKGSDRVFMQCFPVLPKDRMKVRVGVTAPLETAATSSECRLPYFIEQNFQNTRSLEHQLTIGSQDAAVIVDPDHSRGHLTRRLQLTVADAEIPAATVRIRNPSLGDSNKTLASTAFDGQQQITQVLKPEKLRPVQRICFVVDGSEGMRPHFSAIANAAVQAGTGRDVRFLLVGDQTHDLSSQLKSSGRSTSRKLVSQMKKLAGRGGYDNVPAILQACQDQRFAENVAIVWLHSAVPIELSPISDLWTNDQELAELQIFDIQVGRGPNRVAEHFESQVMRPRVWQAGTLTEQMSELVNELAVGTTRWKREYSAITDAVVEPSATSTAAQTHLVELFASHDVQQRLNQAYEQNRDEAIRVAETHHIVTPVTGAVVLETDQQFEEAGLTPVDADDKSAIITPEPSTFTLGLFALFAFWGYARRMTRSGFKT